MYVQKQKSEERFHFLILVSMIFGNYKQKVEKLFHV